MTPLERIRIEKAAADCGFEREPVVNEHGKLELRSATFPEVVYVWVAAPVAYRITASLPSLLASAENGEISVDSIDELYKVLQQAAAVARTLPNQVVEQFKSRTQNLPQTTEVERMVVQRVGQNLFRNALLEFWEGRCCVTGLAIPALLRASHIKPWAKCASDLERLDVCNGLLLAPHLDALFDGGWISFSHQGELLVSQQLTAAARAQLGMSLQWSIKNLTSAHQGYLAYHREHEFRTA